MGGCAISAAPAAARLVSAARAGPRAVSNPLGYAPPWTWKRQPSPAAGAPPACLCPSAGIACAATKHDRQGLRSTLACALGAAGASLLPGGARRDGRIVG